MNSNSSKSWFRHFSCKILDVNEHLRISGSADSGIALNASSVYSLKQNPCPYGPISSVHTAYGMTKSILLDQHDQHAEVQTIALYP